MIDKGSNFMKNYKPIIALFLCAIIAVSFVACKGKPSGGEEGGTTAAENVGAETVSGVPVTDKDGKLVTEVVTNSKGEKVTDKNGKTVTAVVTQTVTRNENAQQAKTNAAGKTEATKKDDKNNKDNKNNKNKKDDKTAKTTATTQKVKNPNTVKEIKVSNITETSVKLSWEGVVCDFYELEYKKADAERWDTIDEELNATSIDVSGLESYTKYSFRIRAIIKSKAGKSPSAYTYADATTKAQDKSRKITIKVKLPARNNADDKLVFYVKEGKNEKENIGEADVKLDGSTVKLETKKKYKGVVTVQVRLKKLDEKASAETDKETVLVDISHIGIDTIYDED